MGTTVQMYECLMTSVNRQVQWVPYALGVSLLASNSIGRKLDMTQVKAKKKLTKT